MGTDKLFSLLLLIFARQVTSFSLLDPLTSVTDNLGKVPILPSQPNMAANILFQYGGFIGATAAARGVTLNDVLPMFSNTRIGLEYLSATQGMPGQGERVAVLGMLFTIGGLFTRTYDLPSNIGMGGVIAAVVQYMTYRLETGNLPFAFIRAHQRVNLSFNQHVKMQLICSAIIFSGFGFTVIIFYISKRIIVNSSKIGKRMMNGSYQVGERMISGPYQAGKHIISKSTGFVRKSIKPIKNFRFKRNKKMVEFIKVE